MTYADWALVLTAIITIFVIFEVAWRFWGD
jgi:hypothetical protein